MLDYWSYKWTYGIVSEFMLTAEELASKRDNAIEEMRHLLSVINISGSNLPEAARILGEYYDRLK